MKQVFLLSFLLLLGSVAGECPNGCSGHGSCGARDMCTCYLSFMGNDCSELVCPFGRAHVDIPLGDLNMDGELTTEATVTNQMYPAGTAELYPDAADDEGHFYSECSSAGLCDRTTGHCNCFPGFDGNACHRTTCPGNGPSGPCSGHGTCHSIREMGQYFASSNTLFGVAEAPYPLDYNLWDANATYGCVCDPGYSGAGCEEMQCQYGIDPMYLNDGTPTFDRFQLFLDNTANQTSGSTAVLAGSFKLRVFDLWGDSYLTNKIEFQNVFSSQFTAEELAAKIKAELVALPGSYFDSVEVLIPGTDDSSVDDIPIYTDTGAEGFQIAIVYKDIPGRHRLPELADIVYTARNDGYNLVVGAPYGRGELTDSFTTKAATSIASTPAADDKFTLNSALPSSDPAVVAATNGAPEDRTSIYRWLKSGPSHFLGHVDSSTPTSLTLAYDTANSGMRIGKDLYTSNSQPFDIVPSAALVKDWVVGENTFTVAGDFRDRFRKSTQFVFHNTLYTVTKDAGVTETGSSRKEGSTIPLATRNTQDIPIIVPLAVVCDGTSATVYPQTPVKNLRRHDRIEIEDDPADPLVVYEVTSVSANGHIIKVKLISLDGLAACSSFGAVALKGGEVLGPVAGITGSLNGTITLAEPYKATATPGDIIFLDGAGLGPFGTFSQGITISTVEIEELEAGNTYFVIYGNTCVGTATETATKQTYCITGVADVTGALLLEGDKMLSAGGGLELKLTAAEPNTFFTNGVVTAVTTAVPTYSAALCRSGGYSGKIICTVTPGVAAPETLKTGYYAAYGAFVTDQVDNFYTLTGYDVTGPQYLYIAGAVDEKITDITVRQGGWTFIGGPPGALALDADYQIGPTNKRAMHGPTGAGTSTSVLTGGGAPIVLSSLDYMYHYRYTQVKTVDAIKTSLLYSGFQYWLVSLSTVVTVDIPFTGSILSETDPSIHLKPTTDDTALIRHDASHTMGNFQTARGTATKSEPFVIYMVEPKQSSTVAYKAVAGVTAAYAGKNTLTLSTDTGEVAVGDVLYFQGQHFHVVKVDAGGVITTAESIDGMIDPTLTNHLTRFPPGPTYAPLFRVKGERVPISFGTNIRSCEVVEAIVGTSLVKVTDCKEGVLALTVKAGFSFILFRTRYRVVSVAPGTGPVTFELTVDKPFYGIPLYGKPDDLAKPNHYGEAADALHPLTMYSQDITSSTQIGADKIRMYFYDEEKNSLPKESVYTFAAECSNRGICDHATGQCDCFQGYTGGVCATQNTLGR